MLPRDSFLNGNRSGEKKELKKLPKQEFPVSFPNRLTRRTFRKINEAFGIKSDKEEQKAMSRKPGLPNQVR